MSQATLRYAASVVEKHELMKELKHWRVSTKSCMNEMKSNLRSLKDSEATSKREINFIRAKLVDKLKLLEEKAERQLHDTVRAEEEKIENAIKNLMVRQRRLDIAEIRLKETAIGHKLKRWIEDGRNQIAVAKDALISTKMRDIPTKMTFRLNSTLDEIIQGHSYLGVLSLESNSKVINRIVGGTEDALVQKQDEADGENQSVDPNKPSTESFEKELRKQLGRGMKFTDDRYFKAILDSHASNEVAQKRADGNVGHNKITTVNVTRMDGHTLKTRQGKNDVRSKSVQDLSGNHKPGDNRTVFSAREDCRLNVSQFVAAPKHLMSNKMVTVNDFGTQTNGTTESIKNTNHVNNRRYAKNKNMEQYDREKININDSTASENSNDKSRDKPGVRYLGYDFVKEITYNRDPNNDELGLSQDSLDGQYDIQRPPSPHSISGGSISTLSYTPSSSHASGPSKISPSTARKTKSYFTYNAKFHTKKHPHDTDLCRLTGITALSNGKVVVSDISHLQIMLFDDDLTYLYSLDCPSPNGMCEVSPMVVAVTLFHNRKVLLVKVHDMHMERYREVILSCQETLQAVSFCNDLFYVLCFRGEIHIIESDGRHSKTVRTINTYMKEGETKCLETDPESKAIIVSGNGRVVCFSDEGKRLWQYTNDNPNKKFAPGGIVLYHDRVFVADWAGHRVIELSMSGTFVRNVIVDNIEYPNSISVNSHRGLMFITQTNFFKQEARSRSVKVFIVK